MSDAATTVGKTIRYQPVESNKWADNLFARAYSFLRFGDDDIAMRDVEAALVRISDRQPRL
jgi:hypothetical protein